MSSLRNLSVPNDHSNLHLRALEQRFNRTYRRGSEGNNFPFPCHNILRVHLSAMMEEDHDRGRSQSLSPGGTLRSGQLPFSCSPRSGSSSPVSDCESSIASCTELIAALEALTLELQENKQAQEKEEDDEKEDTGRGNDAETEGNSSGNRNTLTRSSGGIEAEGVEERMDRQSPVKSLNADTTARIEREKILMECKNQIKSLTLSNKTLERRLQEVEEERNLAIAHKAPRRDHLKCWPKARGCVQDLEKQIALNDHYVEPTEIIAVLLESERQYLTGLTLLCSQFQQPMKMLSSFKPDILSMQQLNLIFLNCTELLLLHRVLYEDLVQITQLQESAQVDKLFEILECTFPAFGQYSSFLTNNRPQNVQRELRQLKTKPQFEQLLNHCQKNCEDTPLLTLLNLPTERLSEYSELLTHFLNPRVRALPEDASKRAEALIRFLRNLRCDLSEEKSEWDYTLEKIKLLNKLATDSPIPLEIFNSDVRLVKQGPLTQVLGKKEMPRHCFLFNNYIALAQAKDNQYRIMENRMISLCGAQLHKCVDVEGQAIASDLQSGRSEDKLAFGLTLRNNDSLYLRAGRPNEWKQWVELLEKSIEESQQLQLESQMDTADYRPLYPVEVGPKIAAASLEKLFQQLTSPHFEHQDFMRAFLLTHSCFTTSVEVLTALLNCIKSPDENDRMSQGSDSDLFLFNMEEMSGSSSDCVSASPSIYTIDSDIGSPGPSPSVVRRSAASSAHTSFVSSSPSPNSLLRTGNSDRKAVHSAASYVSTDSDISPHTSAIVVDNAPVSTKDGWAESGELDINSRRKGMGSNLTMTSVSPCTPPGDGYAKLFPTNCVQVPESEPSDAEEQATPLKTAVTPSDAQGSGRVIRRRAQRTLSEGGDSLHSLTGKEEDTIKNIHHSKLMDLELDEVSNMMAELTESLDTEFSQELVKRRSRTLSSKAANRLGIVSSMSTSEPDLVGCIDDDTPPPLPPRDPDMYTAATTMSKGEGDLVMHSLYSSRVPALIRQNSEHSLLTCSMVVAPVSTPEKQKKSKTLEKPKTKKKSKKSDTFSGRGTPSGSVLSSPVRNSPSLYFGSSPSHAGSKSLGPSASFSTADTQPKTPKKTSKWSKISGMVNRKFHRGMSIGGEGDEIRLRNKPQRSQSIPTIKKCGIYSGREEGLSEGGSISSAAYRGRKTSTSHTNSVNLVAKIFSVLSCWVEEFFEDFHSNSELTQSLCDFLETLSMKTSSDYVEHHRAHQLLESLKKKMKYTSMPEPNCPFPLLLSRVIRLTPEVLSMYDWENPDKLMQGREIDLSKSLPKDSPCLKMIAEQLTLMEFSVYAVIQRTELLNCNWKKPNKEKLSPNLCRLIRRTNDMTSWVATEILTRKTPSQRAVVIEHFIQIAYYCYKHNDLHCALNITIALGSACIKSLRQTWKDVDKKYQHRFEKLKESMDYHGKCKKMRENLERLTQESLSKTQKIPSALPYIGAYLDLIYTIEMQSKTYNQDGLVNFAKMTKLTEVVTRVLQYQVVGFNFEPKPDLMAYVTASKRLSENDLFELSMMVEPPS